MLLILVSLIKSHKLLVMPKSVPPTRVSPITSVAPIRVPIKKPRAVAPRVVRRPTPIVTKNLSQFFDECPTEVDKNIAIYKLQLSLLFPESRDQAVNLLAHINKKLNDLHVQEANVPSLTYTTVFIESLKRISLVGSCPAQQHTFAQILQKEDPNLTEQDFQCAKLLLPVLESEPWDKFLIADFNKESSGKMQKKFSVGFKLIGKAANRQVVNLFKSKFERDVDEF